MILIPGLRFLRSLGLVVFPVSPLLVFGLVRPIFSIIWVLMNLSLVRRERIFLDYYSGVSYEAQVFSRFWGVVGFGLPQCLTSSFQIQEYCLAPKPPVPISFVLRFRRIQPGLPLPVRLALVKILLILHFLITVFLAPWFIQGGCRGWFRIRRIRGRSCFIYFCRVFWLKT